ncbi:MAG: serine protease [Bdellovibrionales bacterium]
MRTGLVLFFFTFGFLCACKSHDRGPSITSFTDEAPQTRAKLPRYVVESSWIPENMHLVCPSGDCPPQVGLLLFVTPGKDETPNLTGCTGFLVKSDEAASNGHCDLSAQGVGYFVTQDLIRGRQVRRLGKVLFKRFTPHPKPTHPDDNSGRPDLAVFQLDRAITNMEPLELATGPQIKFDKLVGYVVNATDKAGYFSVEPWECRVRRHEAEFPYSLDETPDVIFGFDCGSRGGHSGAPLFAPGHKVVQAVLQSHTTIKKRAEAVQISLKRELLPHEAHDVIVATNVRCLDIPGSSPQQCVQVTADENTRRFNLTQERALAQLQRRPIPDAYKYGTRFRSTPFYIPSDTHEHNRKVEVIYEPYCRNPSVPLKDLKEVVFPSELVNVKYDEWGMPHIEGGEIRMSVGKIQERRGSHTLHVHTTWAAGFGTLSEKDELAHPRRHRGARFDIDLPPCTR